MKSLALKNSHVMKIVLITIIFNLSYTNCQQQQQYKIKFTKDVYSVLPEIPQDYNIVKQNYLAAKKNNNQQTNILSLQKNTKFAQKQAPDFYALKSSDPQYQAQKYNYIKGKNIFTPSYLQLQSKTQQNEKQEHFITFEKQQNKQTISVLQKKPEMIENPPVPNQIIKDKKNEQIINQKSAQLYNQFKNIEVLKEKNLRDIIKNALETELPKQNFGKLILLIIVGLILSFFIIKRATKSEPSVTQRNQERSELRLRDTVQDDEIDSSSDSDEQM